MIKMNFKKYYFVSSITVFMLLLLLVSFKKIHGDTDFFWHLKLGQMAWENKQWITKEIFSLTRDNIAWFNNTQFFDVSTWLIYKNFSFLGLFITRFIFYLLTFYLVWKTIAYKNKNWQILLCVFFCILSLLFYRALFRPEIFAYFYTILYLYLLYTYKYTAKKFLYLIPLVQILWVNTHLSFVTGPALVAVFLGAEFIRHLFKNKYHNLFKNKYLKTYLLIFISSLLASLISPYGLKTISWFWWIYSSQESLINISEWQNPTNNFIFNFNNTYNLPFLFILWGSVYVLIKKNINITQQKISRFTKYSNLPWEDILLLLLFLYQSLTAVRFTMISSMIIGIILAKNWPKKIKNIYVLNSMPILGFLLLSINILKIPINSFGLGYIDNLYPTAATQFIKDQHLPGNVLNDYNSGGYLIWALYPEKKVFIDSRTPNVYDNYFYWLFRSLPNENIQKKFIDEYKINFWLWPTNDRQILSDLWESSEWKVIYFDNTHTIYIKNIPENQYIIDKFAYNFFSPYFNESDIKNICSKENLKTSPDLKNKLIDELNKGLLTNNQNWIHYQNLALVYQNCDFQSEDKEKIINNLKKAVEINPNENNLYYLLGFNYLNYDDELAKKYFKKAGKNYSAYLIGLGTAQYNSGEYKKSLKTLLKAAQTPGEINAKYYQIIARVYYTLDKYNLAIEYHNRYLNLSHDYSAETYTDLSQSYFYQGNLDRAKEYLQMALQIDANYPLALEMEKEINK